MNKIFKVETELKSKKFLTPAIGELKYTIPEGFIYTPGQFIGLRVLPFPLKSYSIVDTDMKERLVTLILDIKTKSGYFEKTEIGDKLLLQGPYGIYGTKPTELDKVFISTGTGIAPFIPMIKQLIVEDKKMKVYNFFGVQYEKEDIAYDYLKDLAGNGLEYIRCVTQEESRDKLSQKGRVTEVIPKYNFDWLNTEFYICGAAHMILDMEKVLWKLGATKIYYEKFD